jgi:hypothetical protein
MSIMLTLVMLVNVFPALMVGAETTSIFDYPEHNPDALGVTALADESGPGVDLLFSAFDITG